MLDHPVVRWVVAIVIALGVVALLAYARGKPGNGGRSPDAPGHSAPALVHRDMQA